MIEVYKSGCGGFGDVETFTIEAENHRRYIILYFHSEYFQTLNGTKKMDEQELTEKIPKTSTRVTREFVFSKICGICKGTHFEEYCPKSPKEINMSAFY